MIDTKSALEAPSVNPTHPDIVCDETSGARRERVMIQMEELAVVVAAGGSAKIEVRTAEELALDLASAAARLGVVGLRKESGVKHKRLLP